MTPGTSTGGLAKAMRPSPDRRRCHNIRHAAVTWRTHVAVFTHAITAENNDARHKHRRPVKDNEDSPQSAASFQNIRHVVVVRRTPVAAFSHTPHFLFSFHHQRGSAMAPSKQNRPQRREPSMPEVRARREWLISLSVRLTCRLFFHFSRSGNGKGGDGSFQG